MFRLQRPKTAFRWVVRIEGYNYYYIKGEPMSLRAAHTCAEDLAGLMALTDKKYTIFIQSLINEQKSNYFESLPG